MNKAQPTPTDALAKLLTAGTLLAAFLGIVGVIMALATKTVATHASLREFHGAAGAYRTPGSIFSNALALDAKAIMQFAALVLIATPVMRVLATFILFAKHKDWLFVAVSAIVLCGLALGLVGIIE